MMLHLGDTEIPESLVEEWLRDSGTEHFTGTEYSLFEHNCNTFANFALFLTGRQAPTYITELPDHIKQSPLGRLIAQWADSFANANRQGAGGSRTLTPQMGGMGGGD